MTTRDIINFRLVNQQIARSQCKSAGEVVAHLGAMQAQDFQGALWSIGLRWPKSTLADVKRAISERKIVRTWPMRGTLHFLAAADVRWMLELLAPRMVASRAARHVELGLDTAVFLRCEKLMVKALRGGKQLMRKELLTLLENAGISTDNQRGYVILWQLAHERVICFGAHQEKQPTFALLEEWVPQAKSLPRDESLAELARRYFTGHGPATLRDFGWWSGLKAADAKAGLAMASAELEKIVVDDTAYWMPRNTPPLRDVSPAAYLLPGFDEYMLGYTDRGAALPAQHAKKIMQGGNGVFTGTAVIDGRVAGVWKRVFKKKSASIALTPFARLKKSETKALGVPLAHFGKFNNMPAVLTQTGADMNAG